VGTNAHIPVAVDPAGNVYTLVHTNTDAIIQGDTVHTITGSEGVVVTKLDPAGNFLWGSMVNCDAGTFSAEKFAVDNAGATYTSFIYGNGGQAHLADTTFLPSGAGGFTLVIKLDSSGHFVRSRVFPDGAVVPLSCLGTDVYVAVNNRIEKLDSALNTVWTVSAPTGTVYFDGGNRTDIFVNPNGELIASVYEGGNSFGTIPFGNDSIHFNPGRI
jgi:hypothetical protein